MSFFKKMLSKVGIGAAKVDTVLHTETFIPGDPVEGTVTLRGGNVAQDIEQIYFRVVSTFEDEIEFEGDDSEDDGEEMEITRRAVIAEFTLAESFTLSEDETREFPISFTLPEDTPATVGKTRVWVKTGLDIRGAVDPGDRDDIRVLPHPLVAACLGAAEELGFRLSEVVCEPAPSFFNMRVPFVQEYEFKPDSGPFSGRLDEIELVFKVFPDHVEVIMEVDRKARGLAGMFQEMTGTDETLVSFSFGEADLPDLTHMLEDVISQYC